MELNQYQVYTHLLLSGLVGSKPWFGGCNRHTHWEWATNYNNTITHSLCVFLFCFTFTVYSSSFLLFVFKHYYSFIPSLLQMLLHWRHSRAHVTLGFVGGHFSAQELKKKSYIITHFLSCPTFPTAIWSVELSITMTFLHSFPASIAILSIWLYLFINKRIW